jgi:hypothetical protein
MAEKGYVLVAEDQVDQKAAELAAINTEKQRAAAPSPSPAPGTQAANTRQTR